MKRKLLLLLILLAGSFTISTFADNCTQTFSGSGQDDDPTVVTVLPGNITCTGGGAISGITLNNTAGSFVSTYCGSWYDFDLIVDGITIISGGCQADFDGTVISVPFTSIVVQSNDIDAYSDGVTITFDLDIVYIPAACPPPSSQIVDNITITSADLNWTTGGATTWNIEYGPTGFTQGTGTMITSTVLNPYPLGALTASTTYDWYVQDDCGGDQSMWVGPNTFSTLCDLFSAPFSENFDGVTAPVLPNCWASIVNSTSTYTRVETYTLTTPHSAPNHVRLYNSSDISATLMLITPELSDLTSQSNQIRFYGKASTANDLLVGTMSDPGDENTFTIFQTIPLTSTYTEYTIVFDALYAGTDNYIAFKHGQGGSTYRSLYIDNFNYEPIPSCPAPTFLVHSNETSLGADLGWTSPDSFFDVYIVPAGDPAPITGSTPTIDDNSGTLSTWMGGAANTAYDWYVRTDCGQNNTDVSTWSGPDSFTTSCTPFTPDYLEDFTTFLPDCWDQNKGPVTGPTGTPGNSFWIADGFANDGSTGSARINLYTTTREDWLITPDFDLTVGGFELNFDVAVTTFSGTGASAMGSDDQVQLLVTTDGGSSWVNLMTWNTGNTPSNTGDNTTIDISGYNQSLVQFAFWGADGPVDDAEDYNFYVDNFKVRVPPSCAQPTALSHSNETITGADLSWTSVDSFFDIYIVLDGEPAPDAGTTPTVDDNSGTTYIWTGGLPDTDYDWYVRTDCGQNNTDVSTWSGPDSFTTLVACPAPTDMTLESVTTTTAEVSWTENGGATVWNIEYGPDGFTQGTGTMITGTTENPLTITGLTAASDYDWYVQADCGSYQSTWTGPGSFSTPCESISSFPVTEDFEAGGTIPTCWTNDPNDAGGNWYFVTSDGNGPTSDHTSGSGYYALLDDYGISSANSPFNLITPTYDFSAPDKFYQIRYWAWIGSDGAANPIHIDVSDDGGVTWTEDIFVHDQSSTDVWFENTVMLSAYTTSNVIVRFRAISIYGYGTDNSGIDDVTIEEMPDCPPPSAQNESFVSGYQADLGWTENGTAAIWNIEWDTNGFTKGTGNMITGTAENPYTLLNLDPETVYDWYVQSDCGGDQSAWVGPSTFTTTVACPQPSNQSETVTTTTADLSWIPGGTEPEWNIEWGLEGFTQGTGTLISNTNMNPYELADLTENTLYDWYVQSDCGGDQSTWAGPSTFNTACDATAVPYYENFDGVTAPLFPSCMVVENLNLDNEEWQTTIDFYLSSPNSAMIGYNSALDMDDWFFTQGLELTGGVTYDVSFAYAAASESFPEKLAVDWGTNPNASAMSGNPIYDDSYIDGGWYAGGGTFTPSTTGVYYVGFHGYSDADMFNLYVDDIAIVEVFAASTWTGTDDNDWSNAGNWNPGLPSSTTNVTIPAGLVNYPTVNNATSINDLLIESGSGGDASLLNDGLLIVYGNATVQRYVTGGVWHDFSASTQGQTLNSVYFGGNPDVWLTKYNEPDNTVTYLTELTDPMNPGDGFAIWVEADNDVAINFNGALQRSDVTPTLSYSGPEPLGYNLVGNPFASPVDLDLGTWNLVDVITSFWVWDPNLSGGTYREWNTTSETGSLADGIVPMGQAFFAQATSATASITIPMDARVHSNQGYYKSTTNGDKGQMSLRALYSDTYDEMNIVFREKAMYEFEPFDTRKKLTTSGAAPQIYSQQFDEQLSINGLPLLPDEGSSVNVGYQPGSTGDQIIEADLKKLKDIDVYLEDEFTGNMINLVQEPVYMFTSSVDDKADRFILHFSPMVTGVENDLSNVGIRVYAYDGAVYIQSSGVAAKENKEVWIYDMFGRTVVQTSVDASELSRIPVDRTNAYLIVRTVSKSGVITKKVYIQ